MHAEASSSFSSGSSSQTKRDIPCRYFYRSGACKRGDKCLFSHDTTRQQTQLRASPALDSATTPARLSAQATEFKPGSAFRYSLSASAATFQPTPNPQNGGTEDEWQDLANEPQPSSSAQSASKSKAVMKGVPASVREHTEPCAICMEVPTVYAQHVNCDHYFCPPCLQQWRRQHDQAKNKNCPTCRTRSTFTFVTPQPFTSGARALALQRFRQRAAQTPCRNFTKSLHLSDKRETKAFCVFGDACIYQHHIDGQPHKFGVGRFSIQRASKGTRRIAGLRGNSQRSTSTEFFSRIQDMDERVRMFLSTRIILNARSQMAAA